MTPGGARTGTVLALAILVLVALQLLAHGALLMARAEWASSLAGLRLLQARGAAHAAALSVMSGSTDGWDSVATGGMTAPVTGRLAEHPFLGQSRRLSREYWLVEGRGRAKGEPWAVTDRVLVWRLDPVGRVAAARGAAEIGGALSGAGQVAWDPDRPSSCRPWEAALDSLGAPGRWDGAAGLAPSDGGEPSLGALTPADLFRALPALSAATGTPMPVLWMGRCDASAPWNWGDPRTEGAPCGDRLAAWFVAGDLLLTGGMGQGILAVRGNLELVGTRFDGVLLVGGSLILRDGADARGMVRVGGDMDVATGSRMLGSPCRAVRVLDAFGPELRFPVLVQGAGVMEGGG